MPLTTVAAVVAADLAGYTMTTAELQDIPESQRWLGTETPSVKLQIVGVNNNRQPKGLALSTAAVIAAPLTAGQGLRVTLKTANFAQTCLGINVWVAESATAEHRLAAFVPTPAAAYRNNTAHAADVIIDIARKPNVNQAGESQMTAILASDSTVVYQVVTYDPGLGLGPDGVTINGTPETFDSTTNGVVTTFATTRAFNIQFSVNPANVAQLEAALQMLGFALVGGSIRKGGSPESFTPPVLVLDTDLSPYVPTSGQNRVVILGLQGVSTDAFALQKAFNSKEPFTITLNSINTDFVSPQNLISYTRF